MKGFYRAIALYAKAWNIASTHRLWRFLWIPFLATIFSAVLLGFGIFILHDTLMSWIEKLLRRWELWTWVIKVLWWSILLFLGLLSLFVFRYLVLALSFPFMSRLSLRVEQIMKSPDQVPIELKFSLTSILRDWARGVTIAFMLFISEIGWIVLFAFLSLIPGLGLITGPVIFGIQAFYAGGSNMDFTLERYKGIRESWLFMRSHPGPAIGNGLVFLFILALPLIGLFVAPLLGTTASTLHTLELLNEEN